MKRWQPFVLIGSAALGSLCGFAVQARGRADEGGNPEVVVTRASLIQAAIDGADRRLRTLDDEEKRLRLELEVRNTTDPCPEDLEERLRWHAAHSKEGVEWDQRLRDELVKNPELIVKMVRLAVEEWQKDPSDSWGVIRWIQVHKANFYYEDQENFPYADRLVQQERFARVLWKALETEPDGMGKRFMRELLSDSNSRPSAPDVELLIQDFRTSDWASRQDLLKLLRRAGSAFEEQVRRELREAIRAAQEPRERRLTIFGVWEQGGLPVDELRGYVREAMASSDPSDMIDNANAWVMRYISPQTRDETVGLFQQTLSKPIDPYYKASSLLMIGSLATTFSASSGRQAIHDFVVQTDDVRLRRLGNRLIEIIDSGAGLMEINKITLESLGIVQK